MLICWLHDQDELYNYKEPQRKDDRPLFLTFNGLKCLVHVDTALEHENTAVFEIGCCQTDILTTIALSRMRAEG